VASRPAALATATLIAPVIAGTQIEEIAMNRRFRFAAALCAACVAPAFAQEGQTTLPPIQVTQYVAECAHPALPVQRQVGEWTGLHNFGQAYAAREQLMADIGRACKRSGVERVQVATHPQIAPHFIAATQQAR
jgi:hypothetical protein